MNTHGMSRTKYTDSGIYARSTHRDNIEAISCISQRLRCLDAQVPQLLVGAENSETFASAGTATLVDSVSYVTAPVASYSVTLPDATRSACENNIVVGTTKTFLMTTVPAVGQTVTIQPTTPGAGAATVLSAQGQGVTYVWTGAASGWCRTAGSGGGGGSGTLADTLHATATVALGQEPTTSVAFPQPTAIEGLQATLNLDTEVNAPSNVVRPSVAGQRGRLGLTAVTTSDAGVAGPPLVVQGSAGTGAAWGGPVWIYGGECEAAGISGAVFIASSPGGQTGTVDIRSANALAGASGDLNFTTGSGFAGPSGPVNITTGSGNGASSGYINITTGNGITNGSLSGDVTIRSGDKAGSPGDTGDFFAGTGSTTSGGNTGSASLRSGNTGNQGGFSSGTVSVESGQNNNIGGFTGSVRVASGNAVGQNTISGAVDIVSGSCGDPTGQSGNVTVRSGNTLGTTPGTLQIRGGTCQAGLGNGGLMAIDGGDAQGSGDGGTLQLRAGLANGTGTGGGAELRGGNSTSGNAGNVTISGGSTLAPAPALGGSVTISATDGSNGGSGGNITFETAASNNGLLCSAVGLISTDVTHACHFVASAGLVGGATNQISCVGGTLHPLSSDMAGQVTGIAAALGTGVITFSRPWPGAVAPFIVLTIVDTGGAVADSAPYVTAATSNGFTIQNTSANFALDVNYLCIGGTF